MSKRNRLMGWWATLAAAVLLCTALPASAQERGQGRGRGFGGGIQISNLQLLQAEQVQQELKLTDDQKQQVEKIAEENREKAREAFQGDREGAFARMREVAQEADEKVADVLKDDQAKRVNEIRLQANGPAALVGDEELARKLNVSREQRQQIREVLRAQGEKTGELFRGRQGEGGRERVRERMEELRKETNEQLLAVLSDEQKEQWQEMTGAPFELDRSQLRFGGRGFGGRGPGRGRPRGNN